MPNGVDIRAQIDTETAKGLFVINGGGALALLSLLVAILDKDGYESFALAVMIGILILMAGLVFAVLHNYFRRLCSHHYSLHNMHPPKGRIGSFQLWAPTVCCLHIMLMALSIMAFIVAGSSVAITGINTLEGLQQKTEQTIDKELSE